MPPSRIRLLPIWIASPSRIFGTPVISAAWAKAGSDASNKAKSNVFDVIGNPGKGWCAKGARIVRRIGPRGHCEMVARLSTSRHCTLHHHPARECQSHQHEGRGHLGPADQDPR